jgi:hypothetical protein
MRWNKWTVFPHGKGKHLAGRRPLRIRSTLQGVSGHPLLRLEGDIRVSIPVSASLSFFGHFISGSFAFVLLDSYLTEHLAPFLTNHDDDSLSTPLPAV